MASASQTASGASTRPAAVVISYTGPDQMWAEWLGEQLQRAGCMVEAAEWSGDPDVSLLSMLKHAAERYGQCVIVLSSTYLHAVVPSEEIGEAAAAWAVDHPGVLIPVLVRRCELPSRFWQLTPVDLREVADDREAARRLLSRVLGVRRADISGGEAETMTRFPGRRTPVWSPRIPMRNPYFTGRDDMLRELRRRLTTDVTALLPHSLQGLSGVGKTQLAMEYAYRFAADYDVVWWVPAEDRASARQALAELALRLDMGGPAAETGELIRAALDALRTGRPYQRWLVIFDNAGVPDDIRPLLLSGPGHTLITSRDQDWERQTDVLGVDVYSRQESTGFLRRRSPGLSKRDANRLAQELGDLPLALEHVAAWLSTTRMTADDYLGLLQKQAAELLSTTRPANYPVSVAATWIISMNRLHEHNPAAAQLLEMCAFIGPNPIALSLFASAPADVLPSALSTELRSAGWRTEILQAIRAYSLSRVSEGPGGEPSLQQHRLVQAVVRDTVSPKDRAAYRSLAHRLLAAADPGDPATAANWPTYSALLPHLRSSGAVADPDPDVRRLILHEARALRIRGEYRTCLDLVTDAAPAWSAALDPAHPDMFLARQQRVNALHGLGRFAEALRVSQEEYDLGMERFGPDHPDTLRGASGLALAHRRLGNFAAARPLDEHAFEASARDSGRNGPETLRHSHNLAFDYRMSGDFAAALEIDRYNAKAYASLLGPDDIMTVFAANNVARDLRECGQYYEALAMQEATYARYRELLGEEGPETLRAMKNLAVSRRKAGRNEEAWQLAEDVLGRHRHKYGELHPETLAASTNFANDHRCLGQYAGGRGFAEQALRGYTEIFGPDHGFTACAAVNLAILARMTDDPEQARAMNEAALDRLRRTFGQSHRYTLSCAVNLASDLAAARDFQAARELDEECLAKLRKVSGEDHPYTLSCSLNLALDLRNLGKRTAYSDLFADTMNRYHRTLGAAHPEAVAAAARERACCDIEPPPV